MTDVDVDRLEWAVDTYLNLDRQAQIDLYRVLNVHEQAELERRIAMRTAMGWRADPLSFAMHLSRLDGEPEPVEDWRHIVLLSKAFAEAIRAYQRREVTEWRRQQWKVGQQLGKTTFAGWGMLWALDLDPTFRWIYLGYAAERVDEEAASIRDRALRHQRHLRFRLKPDRRARGRFVTEQGGGLYAAGITGGVAGYPGDGVILDDLIKGLDAGASAAVRNRADRVYTTEARMRLQGEHCPIFDLGTRVNEDDVTGRNDRRERDGGEKWHRIIIPATCVDPETDPLGRELGEVTEPRRFGPDEVAARAKVAGTFAWAAIGQQNPVPEEGAEVKRGWFKLEPVRPPRGDVAVASWDMKNTDRQVGDNAVGQVWYRIGSSYWCVEQIHGVWSTPHVRAGMALLQVRFPQISGHYIENTGKAPDMIPMLRAGDPDYVLGDDIADDLGITSEERPAVQTMLRRGLSGIVPVKPVGDKKARTRALLSIFEAGDVHLFDDKHRPWAHELINEAVQLGNVGVHDDMLDAMTQAISRLRHGPAQVSKPRSDSLAAPPLPPEARAPVVGRPSGGIHRPTRRLK